MVKIDIHLYLEKIVKNSIFFRNSKTKLNNQRKTQGHHCNYTFSYDSDSDLKVLLEQTLDLHMSLALIIYNGIQHFRGNSISREIDIESGFLR